MSDDTTLKPSERPPAAPAPYLETLNPDQRGAVETLDGPVLVLAGAGTGKTRVLTTRLAHILVTQRAWPSQILAVTFTNKAAREMRERVARLVGPVAEDMWVGTFHSVAARILRRHAELIGRKSNFTILDTDDQLRLLKQVIQVADIDDKKWPARALLAIIQRWKDRALMPDKVPTAEIGEFANGRTIELYRDYQGRLQTLNACDFGDLLMLNVELFTADASVLADYQRRFRYILVDEYQDTNVAQYLWLRLLAREHRNICCVGDDDQSIYSWRGAEVGNILRFEKDFEGASVVRLEQNYRSTPEILAAASGLIAHNSGRLGKTLWTEAEGGEKITVRGVWDGESEARFVAEEIEVLHSKGGSLDQIAVLVRASFQMREFEERFITIGVPYRVIGGPRFYERQEIRDALAYLRVVHQPDDGLAFERIVNVPRRGIGSATIQAIHYVSRAQTISLVEAARRLIATDELRPQARRAIAALLADFDRWRSLVDVVDHVELVETVLDESGYTGMWQNDKSPEAPGRLENLKELVSGMEEFEDLGGFLEHVSLVMEAGKADGGEMVSLMTLHAAKGLEFDNVFLPGWEEGVFPNQRTLDEGGAPALEEERRLAYVGITRARKRVMASFAANRRIYNQWQSSIPSRFIDELPSEHVETVAEQGLYGGNAGYGGGMGETDSAYQQAGRGPGYGRLRAARGSGVIDGSASTVHELSSPDGISLGMRVFHQKFGYGKVTAVDGNKLDIAFEKAGAKKVMDSFVTPA
ncbi:MAG: DNA helicase-2/ATP-dependent DNA helicase PcrA [Alphaproteobacteria bacterium]|jgi:DNA helicase-2/ATP-dependent DNA helicase PcrA